MPSITANTPIIKLINTYDKAIVSLPLSNRVKVSAEKVEKVLNPPQNPVININL